MPTKDKKRKARKKVADKVDVTVPLIKLDIIGSENDPCFGKLNDPRHPICMQCGDCEICAIVMSQNNHVKRAQIESKQSFKDVEEGSIPPQDKKVIRKAVKERIKEMIKGEGPIDEQQIVNDIYGKYMHDGYRQRRIRKIIHSMAEKSKFIINKNNKYSWKGQKA